MARSLPVCFQKICSSLVSVNIFSEVSMGYLIRFVVLMLLFPLFMIFFGIVFEAVEVIHCKVN